MSKLKCMSCGEEIESGIANVLEHQFEKCGAIYEDKYDGFAVTIQPFIILEKIDNNIKP